MNSQVIDCGVGADFVSASHPASFAHVFDLSGSPWLFSAWCLELCRLFLVCVDHPHEVRAYSPSASDAANGKVHNTSGAAFQFVTGFWFFLQALAISSENERFWIFCDRSSLASACTCGLYQFRMKGASLCVVVVVVVVVVSLYHCDRAQPKGVECPNNVLEMWRFWNMSSSLNISYFKCHISETFHVRNIKFLNYFMFWTWSFWKIS